MKHILLIPHIHIQNANALSSPYTIGFPAMTAWLGAVHALQRKLNQNKFANLEFKSLGVVCHELNLQTHKGQGDFDHSIIGTANPLDRDGNRSAFIEEARCHIDVTLVIEYDCQGLPNQDEFCELVSNYLHSGLKVAGGDICDFKPPKLESVWDEQSLRKLTRKLMPGYVIIERRELMVEAMSQGRDAIDALLDYLKIMHRSQKETNGEVVWTRQRKIGGWIVPIATGFHGITELGNAKNQRDPNTQHRFAESVVTLGEFIMPYRIKELDEMLWHYHVEIEKSLYLCQQNTKSF